jgi:hypothetical protein
MNVERIIETARGIKELIGQHIYGIWPGFVPILFILYDGGNQVAIGDKWPDKYINVRDNIWVAEGRDNGLMGNTATVYHGETVAIWDTRTWEDDIDISDAAAGIAHEMFHAFQRTGFNQPQANELLLPQYPHSAKSLALVMEENKRLEQIIKNPDPAAINRCLSEISALRGQRVIEIGQDYMSYDIRAELHEGTAAYVEIRMKAAAAGISTSEAAKKYLAVLEKNEKLLVNYRWRCYSAGLAMCLALDVISPGWQTEWMKSNTAVYDWIRNNHIVSETEIKPDLSLEEETAGLLSAFRSERERKINEFMNQPLKCYDNDVGLTGFDPMNLVCHDGRCLHMHGMVRIGGAEYLLNTPFLAEYGENIIDIKKLWLPKEAQDALHH